MRLTNAAIVAHRIYFEFMTKTALFISPHLDDVAFSCGGTFARMASEGWRTILCTIFTKSVLHPKGFALACQLDKNLAADVDYMKLRRTEDCRAAKILGAAEVLHLNFPEAPHRGYDSAPELFAGEKTTDQIWLSIAEHLALLDEIHQPEIVFAPQGLGNHADHLQTIRAALKTFDLTKLSWYRDTPYAIRQPNAPPSDLLPPNLSTVFREIKAFLPDKIAACAAYQSQISYQFGGESELAAKLGKFHRTEAEKGSKQFLAAEIQLLSSSETVRMDFDND
ncbi:MAG: PIG-L family deacetylase [Acidobacteriota bacterium]|nr:PIG-L family deacetylase [Acidobacteriota bacterium]